MISGIRSGSSMGIWGNMAAMNDLRLSQALANRGHRIESVGAVSKFPSHTFSSSSEKFLKEYKGHLSELEKLAKDLSGSNRNGALNALGVTSDNNQVLTAHNTGTIHQNASYTVEVKQLAAAQRNESNGFKANEAPTLNGSFVLETSVGTFGFEIDSTDAESNEEMMDAIAKEINGLKAGVTAQVVRNGGKVSLALTGNEVGENNRFAVSGDFADQLGLGNVTQAAQNAVYTVDKKGDSLGPQEYTASSNKVTIGSYQIEATLKEKGTSTVEVGPDVEGMADKVGKLVDKYNETLRFLDRNSDRGVGVLQQMRRMIQPPTSLRSMRMAGIDVTADGTYSFDRATFTKNMEQNPDLMKDIIGGSHGFAQGIQKDAEDGQRVPSAALVDTTNPFGAKPTGSVYPAMNNRYDTDMFKMLSTYNRTGVYNMSNFYTVGTMMSMFI